MNNLEESVKILENGWCVGTFNDGDKYCAVGALRHVIFRNGMELERRGPEILALVTEIMESEWLKTAPERIKKDIEFFFESGWLEDVIFEFNDAQETSAPVIELFKHAAKRLDSK